MTPDEETRVRTIVREELRAIASHIGGFVGPALARGITAASAAALHADQAAEREAAR